MVERTATPRTRGSTLIELLVALILLGVGASALLGGMRASLRSAAGGAAMSRAAAVLESRFESLRVNCQPASGGASIGPVSERWQVVASPGAMLPSVAVMDSLAVTMTAGIATRVVHSIVRCPQ